MKKCVKLVITKNLRAVIAVYEDTHTKHIGTVCTCTRNVKPLLMFNQVLHIGTTIL